MKDSLSHLVSKRTLEIRDLTWAVTFDKVKVVEDPYPMWVQGFTLARRGMFKNLAWAEKAVEEYSDLWVNLINSHDGSEIVFIKGSRTAVNEWYRIQHEGRIARQVCIKFDYFRGEYSPEEAKEYKKQVEEELSHELIQI